MICQNHNFLPSHRSHYSKFSSWKHFHMSFSRQSFVYHPLEISDATFLRLEWLYALVSARKVLLQLSGAAKNVFVPSAPHNPYEWENLSANYGFTWIMEAEIKKFEADNPFSAPIIRSSQNCKHIWILFFKQKIWKTLLCCRSNICMTKNRHTSGNFIAGSSQQNQNPRDRLKNKTIAIKNNRCEK